jgi:hypothetical protein
VHYRCWFALQRCCMALNSFMWPLILPNERIFFVRYFATCWEYVFALGNKAISLVRWFIVLVLLGRKNLLHFALVWNSCVDPLFHHKKESFSRILWCKLELCLVWGNQELSPPQVHYRWMTITLLLKHFSQNTQDNHNWKAMQMTRIWGGFLGEILGYDT